MLGRELVYLACRHHILEAMLRGFSNVSSDQLLSFNLIHSRDSKMHGRSSKRNNTIPVSEGKTFTSWIDCEHICGFQNWTHGTTETKKQLILEFLEALHRTEVGFEFLDAIILDRWIPKASVWRYSYYAGNSNWVMKNTVPQ